MDTRDEERTFAVVGMACRYPGGCTTPEKFWELVERGGDAIARVPRDRWDADLTTRRGARVPQWGGFLDAPYPSAFDAGFFGISPQEANALDPQQRMLLETAWEALEDAAIPADALRGSNTGVYVGISTADHHGTTVWGDLAQLDPFTATGASFSAAAGRIAYLFGFEGPAMAVDTACSSGLVAFHLACQALRDGDCDLALVAGVNALLAPHLYLCLAEMNLLSADGRCKTFDAAADGYVRAEGCGVVVLKRAAAARADGDRILALVRGTAVNQDGRTNSLTSPSAAAQEKVIRHALRRAGLTPADLDYVETHGTGTPLGDIVETRALTGVFGGERARPLAIGSVKTNIGHLEAGAGIAGVIKTIQSMRYETIPPHPHLRERNSGLAWDDATLTIPREPLAWPRGERPRRAGVSSFGFSGTNAHVILEEAPADDVMERRRPAPSAALCEPGGSAGRCHISRRGTPALPDDGDYALTLSAKTADALHALALRYIDYLGRTDESRRDISYTAANGRTRFEHAITVAGDWIAELRRFTQTGATTPCAVAPATSGRKVALPRYAFQYENAPRTARIASDALLQLALESNTAAGRERFVAALNELARTLLSDAPLPPLDDDLPLVQQGFTSLVALDFRARLEAALAIEIPATALFNYPTLRQLSGFLAEKLRPALVADDEPADVELALFDGMSDVELREFIDRELRQS
ncbi:MAG: type I polyketide synthase [Thermoanaerobaculia bacterium]